jgi:glucokinase
MTDYPLLALMQDQFPLQQVRLINDANAAALAEHRLGALRGCRTGLMITLGTGVGGGLILDGELFNGGMGQGVELGHMGLVHQGEACSCGNRGCVEAYCSSAYFLRTGMEPLERMELARSGDSESLGILEKYLDYLSDALVSMIVLLDPEIIALGGGISKAGEFLFGPLRQLVDQKTFFRISPRIEGALLGNKAGYIGAALLDRD